MDLGLFNRVCPSLKSRSLIDERRFDMSRSDKNSEIYVIPVQKKNGWTKEWMQDPRKKLLQVNSYDLSV
jgi:hypothetical protein